MWKRLGFVVALLAIGGSVARADAPPEWAPVAEAVGRAGELRAGVYRVSFPRSDIHLTVDGVPVRAGFALGGWAAFARDGERTMVDGDLVLLPQEVNPVASVLLAHGLEVTALHNHLLLETPHVMYLHFLGVGDAVALARGVRAAVAATKTPPAGTPAAPESSAGGWARAVEQNFGHTGTLRGGVLSIAVPRPEAVRARGVELAPAMGMAHAFNFQEIEGGGVATTGDFVLVDDEVDPVLRELRAGGILVTAIHNHLLHGSPALTFMHFWGTGRPEAIGAALRRALARAATDRG